MKYQGYIVGPAVRRLRKDKHYTVEEIAERTGLSTCTINKLEQGLRNMTMATMFQLMEAFECDANTILCITEPEEKDSFDMRLRSLPMDKRAYLEKTFDFMIEQAKQAA